MLSQNLATLADTVILQRHAYHTRSDVKNGRTVVGTHARAGRLILRTFQCGLWRCAIPHASRCRVSSPSSGYAAPRLLEVWWDSSWPLPLPPLTRKAAPSRNAPSFAAQSATKRSCANASTSLLPTTGSPRTLACFCCRLPRILRRVLESSSSKLSRCSSSFSSALRCVADAQ